MAVGGVGAAYSWQSDAYRRTQTADKEFFAGITETSEKTEKKSSGKVIGLTTIPYENSNLSYGLTARYAADSTEENPIIQVTSNYGGKTVSYNVNIKEVNPENASQLEMFALCSYADDKGLGKGGTFGSYHKLKLYAENAELNGYCENLGGYNDFLYKEYDWKGIIDQMMGDYLDAGMYGQYQDGKNLLTMFENCKNTKVQTVPASQAARNASIPSGGTRKAPKPDPSGTEEVPQKELWEMNVQEMRQVIQEKIDEIFTKLQTGDTEPSFQIGAQSFTEKEWDEFLAKFDSLQDAIRKLMEEERERLEKAELADKMQQGEEGVEALVSESTTCTYPSSDSQKEDVKYITWYTEEGIYCRQAGQTEGYLWSLEFEDPSQYNKVMEFLRQFPSDENLRFAAHENFWRDFLAGKIDEEDFVNFFNSTDHGIPNYTITEGDSMYIDKEKIKYAPYMNSFGNEMYTREEFQKKWEELIEENAKKLKQKIGSPTEQYRRIHPEYKGERIFCEYPGGPLYNAEEMAQKMMENLNDPEYQKAARA